MNHLMLWIYLLGVADKIPSIFDGICVVAFSILIPFSIFGAMGASDSEGEYTFYDFLKKYKRLYMIIILIAAFSEILSVLTPSSKTIAAMIVIPKIAANKDVQQLPANVAHTLNQAVIDWGKELAPKGDKK